MTEKKCPKGKILRSKYTRKDGTKVSATCVKDMGREGKNTDINVTLEKDVLGRFGYDSIEKITRGERRSALRDAVTWYKDPLAIFRRLVYLSTLNKNTNPSLSKKFREDADFVKEKFGTTKISPQESSRLKRPRTKRKILHKSSKKKVTKKKATKNKATKNKATKKKVTKKKKTKKTTKKATKKKTRKN
tara:strand:- start:4242 stop:4808 length:567 start_codon:yes stop_codon:yes gene_type:complete